MQIFLAVWREFYRQKSNLFFTTLFPCILVFILGTMLEQWNISEYEIPKIHVAYAAQEEYPAFEQFLQETEAEGLLTVDWVQDEETALAQIDGFYTAVLIYDAKEERIDLYQGSDSVADRALHAILESYSGMEQAFVLSVQNGVFPETETWADYVRPKNLGVERSMIDYYAVAMLVMILFMGGGIGGAVNFYEFQKNGLFRRLVPTPAGRVKVFCLMVLGEMPMLAMEIGAVMLCSTVLFGAHYGKTFVDNLALIAFFGIVGMAVQTFSAVVGTAMRVNPTAVMMPLTWMILFFSGSFARIKIDGITQMMPAWQIQEAAFDLTLFGNYGRLLQVGGVCLVCCAVFAAAGAMMFYRKKGESQ